MRKNIQQTLDSREVAEMIQKEHKLLMRDIRRYSQQLNENKIAPVEFFVENSYKDSKGEERPCYKLTKKGCEFVAHKLTGKKGTEFTAKYINRFHEMEDELRASKAAGTKKITFLQEVKAAEYATKGMNQQQRIAFYTAIYNRHGLNFGIEPEPVPLLEDKEYSNCANYRQGIINAVNSIGSPRRLMQIYTISKCMLKKEKQ